MEDLSLHILDIAENSLAAGAKNIGITIKEDTSSDLLTIEISDDGKGMEPETAERAADPFYTTRTTRKVGLGLALLDEAARMASGQMDIESLPGRGTKVRARFQLSHVDRKPIGNMAETLTALVASRTDVDLTYLHEKDDGRFAFNTKDIRECFGELPINSAEVLTFIRKYLTQEEKSLIQ
jgi:anti-sigma regulatory factor (Ser/Thr protein kinase)